MPKRLRAAADVARRREHALNRPNDGFGYLSDAVAHAMDAHVTPGVRASYNTVAGDYVKFSEAWKHAPFPATRPKLAAYLMFKANFVSMRSLLGMYMAGIKDYSDLLGFDWALNSDPVIRKVIRFLKRKYGLAGSLQKAAITAARLVAMCSRVPGWPCMAAMSHDDRVWVTAAAHGLFGALRGGEFASGSANGRPVLRHMDVSVGVRAGTRVSLVNVRRPKARWWEVNQIVPCFSPGAGALLCPPSLLEEFRRLSVVALADAGPAFPMANGNALSKRWFLKRATELWNAAGIEVYDNAGHLLSLRASSLRAGAVDSGTQAGLPVVVLKANGRWSSSAWTAYQSPGNELDLAGAARAIWAHATASPCFLGGAGGSAETTLVNTTSPVTSPSPAATTAPQQPADPPLQFGRKVGQRIRTSEWGFATIVAFAEDGSANCTFDGFEGEYNLAELPPGAEPDALDAASLSAWQ